MAGQSTGGRVQQPMSLTQGVAQGLGGAFAGTQAATQYRPQQLAQTNLTPYTNPYESQVVQQSLSDLDRQRQMQQNLLGAQAQAARAFGGSRQGIAEAETNRAFAEQAARTASGLRQAGYSQAQQAAMQDISNQMAGAQFRLGASQQLGNLANLGFGMGQRVQSNLAAQGAMQQALQQQLIDAARQQYGQFVNAPIQALQTQLGAYGGSQTGEGTRTTTQAYKPGLFDYVNLATNVASTAMGMPSGGGGGTLASGGGFSGGGTGFGSSGFALPPMFGVSG